MHSNLEFPLKFYVEFFKQKWFISPNWNYQTFTLVSDYDVTSSLNKFQYFIEHFSILFWHLNLYPSGMNFICSYRKDIPIFLFLYLLHAHWALETQSEMRYAPAPRPWLMASHASAGSKASFWLFPSLWTHGHVPSFWDTWGLDTTEHKLPP